MSIIAFTKNRAIANRCWGCIHLKKFDPYNEDDDRWTCKNPIIPEVNRKDAMLHPNCPHYQQ